MIRLTDNAPRRPDEVVVRTYQPGDHARVITLHYTGQLCTAPIDDSGDAETDLLGISAAYFSDPADHVWVAELYGRPAGMIAARRFDGMTSRVHWLRVDPAYRRTSIPDRLIQTAARHCRDHDVLKVVLDTPVDPGHASALMAGVGLRFSRAVTRGGRQMLEYYVDLYREPRAGCDAPPRTSERSRVEPMRRAAV
ncbi:MAG: GNAT family N-acetyltransferase [Phycisphaera sp.]|nr:GNAT family N-acetyltransferase [Phycisphaera sp.]